MIINGHLLLLVVVTGLFVRVWTVNDRPAVRPHFRSKSQAGLTLSFTPTTNLPRNDSSRIVVALPASARSRSTLLEETWTATNPPFPLPEGIAGGVYRVVDGTGRVARLEIAPSRATAGDASAPVVPPDCYTSTTGSQRWYFIRIEGPVPQSAGAAEPEAISDVFGRDSAAGEGRADCTNRKFDFTGYAAPNWLDLPLSDERVSEEASIEETARPEPPDLPVPQ